MDNITLENASWLCHFEMGALLAFICFSVRTGFIDQLIAGNFRQEETQNPEMHSETIVICGDLESLVIDFHIDEMNTRLVDDVLAVAEDVDLDDRIGAVGETPHIAGGTPIDLDAAPSPRVIVMLVIHACILMIPEVLHRLMLPGLTLPFTA
ncbi:hypothetical protein N7501_008166 [Penicillium viridicatum]|nr:hypothetical protein N7501_008166 [Penicillium viridicatum]